MIENERGFNEETDNACDNACDNARYFNNVFSYASGNAKKKDDECIVEMCQKTKELGKVAFFT